MQKIPSFLCKGHDRKYIYFWGGLGNWQEGGQLSDEDSNCVGNLFGQDQMVQKATGQWDQKHALSRSAMPPAWVTQNRAVGPDVCSEADGMGRMFWDTDVTKLGSVLAPVGAAFGPESSEGVVVERELSVEIYIYLYIFIFICGSFPKDYRLSLAFQNFQEHLDPSIN